MSELPHFQLYGEGKSIADPGFVHIETIASRSRLNSWEIRPHSHDTLDQLLVVRRGTVQARIDDARHSVGDGVVIHIPSGYIHGFQFSDDVDGDVVTFSTELRESLKANQPDAAAMVNAPLIHAVSTITLAPLLASLHQECSGHERGRIAAASWLVGLLLIQVGRMAGGDVTPIADSRINAFRSLVDAHFREHRPIAFYAHRMAITERSLARLTCARLGCSPVHYLHRRLLLESRRQLVYGTQPIARIAEELGFADPSYFTRFYQRMTGERPSAARGSV